MASILHILKLSSSGCMHRRYIDRYLDRYVIY